MRNNNDTDSIILLNNEQNDITEFTFDIQKYALQVTEYLKLDINYIELTLLPSEQIKDLNNQYFNVDSPTDTISFNLTPEAAITGDIYLSPKVIQDNSRQFNTSFETELKTVIIHSILHLTGEKDDSQEQFQQMKLKQEKILEKLR